MTLVQSSSLDVSQRRKRYKRKRFTKFWAIFSRSVETGDYKMLRLMLKYRLDAADRTVVDSVNAWARACEINDEALCIEFLEWLDTLRLTLGLRGDLYQYLETLVGEEKDLAKYLESYRHLNPGVGHFLLSMVNNKAYVSVLAWLERKMDFGRITKFQIQNAHHQEVVDFWRRAANAHGISMTYYSCRAISEGLSTTRLDWWVSSQYFTRTFSYGRVDVHRWMELDDDSSLLRWWINFFMREDGTLPLSGPSGVDVSRFVSTSGLQAWECAGGMEHIDSKRLSQIVDHVPNANALQWWRDFATKNNLTFNYSDKAMTTATLKNDPTMIDWWVDSELRVKVLDFQTPPLWKLSLAIRMRVHRKIWKNSVKNPRPLPLKNTGSLLLPSLPRN